MGNKQIRSGQLIAPFGPGAIYTDRRGVPHVICGLDYWYKRMDPIMGPVDCEKPDEFERFEPRLANLLRVDRFRIPPDFRGVRKGSTPPVNANLKIPAHRFPRWYRHAKTGKLQRFNLQTSRIESKDGGKWYPVRFVAACTAGHLCEFPWKEWARCTCPAEEELYLTDRGGSELSSVSVECKKCGAGRGGKRTLSGVTIIPKDGADSAFTEAGIQCPGERPWLGEGAEERCDHQLVGALLNQTNLYFANTISSILLPDVTSADPTEAEVHDIVASSADLGTAKFLWKSGKKAAAVATMQDTVSECGVSVSNETLQKVLEGIMSGAVIQSAGPAPSSPEPELLAFRRAEFEILRNELDDPKVKDLRVINAGVSPALQPWFDIVNLVERLKETRVFYGFQRLEPTATGLGGMPQTAIRQLFRDEPPGIEQWLPAVEVFGEGIYMELKEPAIDAWIADNSAWLNSRISDEFIGRLGGQFQIMVPAGGDRHAWACRYLLIHSLAHALIAQMVYECGYSTASLRERLYVSADEAAPMAGILIYTAAGDSEGTLGGLVRLGRPERFEMVFRRALNRVAWCSADPVCSEELGGKGSRLANLAACHSCVLLPETSCEAMNHGLDRATLVGMPDNREVGAFSKYLESMLTLAAADAQ